MQYFSASCIIPVTGEPLYNRVLAVAANGSIEGIFDSDEPDIPRNEIQHFEGILCPGFVNTHCHLELSWAKGLIPEGAGLDAFVRELEILKKTASGENKLNSVAVTAFEMAQSGIIATADISNSSDTVNFKSKTRHYFHTFVEVFGSDATYAEIIFEKALGLKAAFMASNRSAGVSIVPHATYSVSDTLFELIASAARNESISIHNQESTDENDFFFNGSGPIADRRAEFNPGLVAYKGTGKRPLESIARYFDAEQKILFVHNTVSEQQDIDFAEGYFKQAYWCLCPNANLYIENTLPDIRLLRSKGCRITLGTDSPASNRQISILEEIHTIQNHFPEIPLAELIRWGTLNGAEFIGMEHKLGSFSKGKTPGIVLIENTDIQTLKLTSESISRLIIPAGE